MVVHTKGTDPLPLTKQQRNIQYPQTKKEATKPSKGKRCEWGGGTAQHSKTHLTILACSHLTILAFPLDKIAGWSRLAAAPSTKSGS